MNLSISRPCTEEISRPWTETTQLSHMPSPWAC